MRDFNEFISYFPGGRFAGRRYITVCRLCGKKKLYINESDKTPGTILAFCQNCENTGHTIKEVLAAAGLEETDMFCNGIPSTAKKPEQVMQLEQPKWQGKKLYSQIWQCVTQDDGEPYQFQRKHRYKSIDGKSDYVKAIYKRDEEKTARWFEAVPGGYFVGFGDSKPNLYNAAELMQRPGEKVYIPEGEKDAETLARMGLLATSFPHGGNQTTWFDAYTDALVGRDIVILTDNDDTGGRYGDFIAKHTPAIAKSVKIIPATAIYADAGEKWDISDIAAEVGDVKAAVLLGAAEGRTDPEPKPEAEAPADPAEQTAREGAAMPTKAEEPKREKPRYIVDNPTTGREQVQPARLADHIRQHEKIIAIRNDANQAPIRFIYDGGYYQPAAAEDIQQRIKKYIAAYNPDLVRMATVREVYEQLCTDGGYLRDGAINADEKIINFENGVLHVDTMRLEAHTPDYFCTIQIPCKWSQEPQRTPNFDRYMETLTGGDKQVQRLLLQYMGACLSNVHGYRYKKALVMYGPGNTGKSQLRELMTRLIGEQNNSNADLQQIEQRFGTSQLYLKRVCGSSDMRYFGVSELSTFKQLTGGDTVTAEFKGQNFFTYKFGGLLWFCCNDLPKFGGDQGEHVYSRFLLVHCCNVIPDDQQDHNLLDKLYSERAGILQKAVAAFVETVRNGWRFSIPDCMAANLAAYKDENDLINQFFNDCMRERRTGQGGQYIIEDSCTWMKLYKVFKVWCNDNTGSKYTPARQEFMLKLERAKGVQTYYGRGNYSYPDCATLTVEAKEEYRCMYGQDTASAQPIKTGRVKKQ